LDITILLSKIATKFPPSGFRQRYCPHHTPSKERRQSTPSRTAAHVITNSPGAAAKGHSVFGYDVPACWPGVSFSATFVASEGPKNGMSFCCITALPTGVGLVRAFVRQSDKYADSRYKNGGLLVGQAAVDGNLIIEK